MLDVMMPVLDGFELVRRLRAVGNSTPVIFLTARDDIEDKVCGLDIGADDYLVKPFAFDELLARIRVVLRKHSGGRTSVLTVGDLEVDTAARKVRRAGREINLSAKEYELLHYLLLNKGIVLSREKSRITSGIMIMRAARTWSTSISDICVRSWTTALIRS